MESALTQQNSPEQPAKNKKKTWDPNKHPRCPVTGRFIKSKQPSAQIQQQMQPEGHTEAEAAESQKTKPKNKKKKQEKLPAL